MSPNVAPLSPTALHHARVLTQPVRDVAMHSARNESSFANARAIPCRRAEPCSARVAKYAGVSAREQLQIHHTVRKIVELIEPGAQLRRIEIVEHPDAQNEIVVAAELQPIERVDCAQADVATD